jgi:hypothetical protein
MSDSPSLIMVQFLAWVADRPRTYRQTMDAWRTSCPRLSVWEDAILDELVRIGNDENRAVTLTARGRAALEKAKTPALRARAAMSAPRRRAAVVLRRC